jgi:tetratricopeptide (TPR) repeat protein
MTQPRCLLSVAVLLAAAPGCAQEPTLVFPATGPLDAEIQSVIAAARSAVEKEPSGPSWMAAGMTFEGNDLLSQARDCYANALTVAETPQAWYRRSVVEGKLGVLEEAVRSIRRAIELVPDYAPSYWRLGGYLFDQGDFDGAREAFQRSTELDGQFAGAWAGLARVDLAEGRPAEAVQMLERQRARFPEHAHLANLMRTALVEAGRGEEAERMRPPASAASSPGKDPWQAEFWRYQGKPLMVRARGKLEGGAPAEGVRLLEEWFAGGSADPTASSYLAWGYFLLGRTGDARATLDAALALDADNAVVLAMLAKIQESSGETEQALATCERILRADPGSGAILAQRGRLLAKLQRPEEAARALAAALDLDGRDPEVWAALGLVQDSLRRFEESRPALERALRGGARTAGVRAALARAYVETGQASAARELLEGAGSLTADEQSLLARAKGEPR